MSEGTVAEAEFLVGHCATCGRDVLTHADFDADDVERRLCLACDAVVERDLRGATREELAALGYTEIPPPTSCSPCGARSCRRDDE